MPLYSYDCISCGFYFESIISVDDRDVPTQTPCEKCGGEIRRGVSECSFRLDPNGSVGWASNGYADNVLGNDPEWRKKNGC